MSNRFDDENNIEMDIKTAFASWGKYVFKCFPQECRLRDNQSSLGFANLF